MAKKRIIITIIILSVLLGIAYISSTNPPCQNFDQGVININETHNISVTFATANDEQAKGLSGCSSIELGQGMYFSFSQKTDAVFWMKDMIIPIDIIWISDNKVIKIEHNVPVPLDNNLIKYRPPFAVDAVLEIGAGHADNYGITEGATVQIQ